MDPAAALVRAALHDVTHWDSDVRLGTSEHILHPSLARSCIILTWIQVLAFVRQSGCHCSPCQRSFFFQTVATYGASCVQLAANLRPFHAFVSIHRPPRCRLKSKPWRLARADERRRLGRLSDLVIAPRTAARCAADVDASLCVNFESFRTECDHKSLLQMPCLGFNMSFLLAGVK